MYDSKKFHKLPVGMTIYKRNQGIFLKLYQDNSQTTYSINAENYEDKYKQALLWLGKDVNQTFPYSWKGFLKLLRLE